MRITAIEQVAIKKIVEQMDPEARVYLFGSRTDDHLRGGDIDLLILSNRISLADKIDILIRIKEVLGEQKIDILVKNDKDASSDPFVAEIMKSAVPLSDLLT